jgi:hypothetical protein
MEKECNCGSLMELELRTIMYGRNVEVRHVPVYHCEDCERNELLNHLKPLLKRVVKRMGNEPKKQKIDFNDFSEYTDVLVQLAKSKKDRSELPKLLDDRVNYLLDLMNVANNSKDPEWRKEIRDRLEQISYELNSTYSA